MALKNQTITVYDVVFIPEYKLLGKQNKNSKK
jgi:hypothetical protein